MYEIVELKLQSILYQKIRNLQYFFRKKVKKILLCFVRKFDKVDIDTYNTEWQKDKRIGKYK